MILKTIYLAINSISNGQKILPVRFLIQSKLYPTIIAKTQHSQNSVGAENSSVGKA